MDPQDKWLIIEDLSTYLKMSHTKLYFMVQLSGSKIGTQWRFDRDEIDHWVKINRNTVDKKSTGESK